MVLHLFNPEHDMALASGLANFTAPHAGRQLRHDLGWLPAMWATSPSANVDGWAVLVDDVRLAQLSAGRRRVGEVRFVDRNHVSDLGVSRVEPWGWDAAIRAQLLRAGVSAAALPSDEQIAAVRELSHRRTAMTLLAGLQQEGTVGTACECHSVEEALAAASNFGRAVLKAPWSSSGRGVRFVSASGHNDDLQKYNEEGWLRNTIALQGAVMVEPCYAKTVDLGMEFCSDGQGTVTYHGLSLFHTQNGAYTGNVIATECAKQQMLNRYPAVKLLPAVRDSICRLTGKLFTGRYAGPFGVDMMIVDNGTQLHPCVEINLRRTMGHVALALTKKYNPDSDDDVRHIMRIDYENNQYKLRIKRL